MHHFAEQVIQEIQNNKGWGSNVVISPEEVLLETGGGLLNARQLFGAKPFLTLNVDVLTKMDLYDIQEYWRQSNALITLSIQERKTSRYFLFDENSKLSGWKNVNTGEEKIVRSAQQLFQKAYSCVAVYSPDIFDLIHQRGKFSLTETFLNLASDHLVNGFEHPADDFIDVGKPESVAVAEEKFK